MPRVYKNGEKKMKKYEFALQRKKIPTPQEYKLCPICATPLVSKWEEDVVEVHFICPNLNCEIGFIKTKG